MMSDTRQPPEPRAPTPSSTAISAQPDDLILSFGYGTDSTGQDYVQIWDNHVLGWIVDATFPPSVEAVPIIIGSLPPAPTQGMDVPQWAAYRSNQIIVPNSFRGSPSEFMTLLTAGGRQALGTFVDSGLRNLWTQWAQANPQLVWTPPAS